MPAPWAIVAFLEGIRSPEKFVAAREAAARYGISILAGSDRAADAALHHLGVMRLDTLDDLLEVRSCSSLARCRQGMEWDC